MYWNDANLRWNPDEYDGITQIPVGLEEIFRPDITLLNSVDEQNVIRSSSYSDLMLENTGTVYWALYIAMNTLCELDLTEWPFDRQTCAYKFASWLNFASSLNLSSQGKQKKEIDSKILYDFKFLINS